MSVGQPAHENFYMTRDRKPEGLNTPAGGGGTPYNGLYGEAPPERGQYLSQASGIKKGRDFTS